MKARTGQILPKARKEGLVVQELSGEVLVYDRDRHKALCLNQTAALVWRHCDGKSSVPQIALAIAKEVSSPIDEDIVWLGVEQLSKSHLLREGTPLREQKSGVSRREVMRRIGLAAAVALPAVTSIIAPTAAQAATCLHTGAPCTTSAECCPGCVCSTTCTGSC